MFQVCDRNLVDEYVLAYDEHNPFSVCAISYVAIYRGKPEEKCPLCGASYLPQYKGKTCNICLVSKIGKESTGLRISSLHNR